MNKKCRILLYVLSIVMVAGCIAAVARTKGSTPEVKVPGEEPAAVVSGEDTEHAGADSGADRAPAREENETAVETTEAEERTEAAEVTEEAEAGGQGKRMAVRRFFLPGMSCLQMRLRRVMMRTESRAWLHRNCWRNFRQRIF